MPSRPSPSSASRQNTTVTVLVPGALREYCNGARELFVSAPSVRVALEQLELLHPSLYCCVCEETGRVRRHVHLFVNSSNVRDGAGVETPLAPGDVLIILPAVSGG